MLRAEQQCEYKYHHEIYDNFKPNTQEFSQNYTPCIWKHVLNTDLLNEYKDNTQLLHQKQSASKD